MKVLLTNDVVGLGDIGDTVGVKPGYARNFLIPRGFAVESGAASAKSVAHKMKQIEAKKKRMQVEAQKESEAMSQIKVQIGIRVGSGGKVFGSVTSRMIADKLAEQDIVIDRRRILMPEPIKRLGKKEVRVKLHADVIPTIEVEVVAIAATAEEEMQETLQAKQAMETIAEERDESLDEEGAEEVAEEEEAAAEQE
ncbi:UNVERIFIED_CONTAM: hypothetical protein GTU68_067194 [Idotea baltica]|nr:hypothetical protein [Idotea baltica]